MVTLARILERWRKLTGPAPLDEFADYDEYWQLSDRPSSLVKIAR